MNISQSLNWNSFCASDQMEFYLIPRIHHFSQFLGGFAEPGKNMQYNQQAPPPQQMMAPPVVVMQNPVYFGQDPVSQKNSYVHQPLG